MSKALILGTAAVALSTVSGSAADLAPPPAYGYGAPGYGYAAPGYGYAAPGYGYASPAVAPAQAGTTIVIVNPTPAYTAPPVVSGYYEPHPVPPAPIPGPVYDYAPGYGYGYTPGYWNRGYWGGYRNGW
jgi:hypothetical protein